MVDSEPIVVAAAAMGSALGAAIGLAGERLARRIAEVASVVAGGILLAVTAFHLAPEAMAEGARSTSLFVAGVIAGWMLERLLGHHGHGGQPSVAASGVPAPSTLWPLAALGLHSMLDGAVYTATFGHGGGDGLVAALGMLAHEAPEGIVAVLLAERAGLRGWRAFGAALMASSLTTPLGWFAAHRAGAEFDAVFHDGFSLSAGLLLYLGVHLLWRAIRPLRAVTRPPEAG